jgi:hypothetical protein
MSEQAKRGPGLLTPTFMSVATAVLSGAMAVHGAQPYLASASDKALLGVIVAGGTFLGARLGKTLLAAGGMLAGGALGGLFGAGAGAALGAVAERDPSRRGDNTVAGGALGGLFGAAVAGTGLAVAGALVGFWGGAALGHGLSRDIALEHVFHIQAAGRHAPAPAHAFFSTPATGKAPLRFIAR